MTYQEFEQVEDMKRAQASRKAGLEAVKISNESFRRSFAISSAINSLLSLIDSSRKPFF